MRFLIVDTVYPGFLNWLYNEFSPGLANQPYAHQVATQVQGFFHTAGAWRPALERRGHEVMEVTANNAPQQVRWMIENDLLDKVKTLSDGLVFGTYFVRQQQEMNWQLAIVAEQIKKFRPDVLLCANLYMFDDAFLNMAHGFYGKAVGQHSAVMPNKSLKRFDAIFSCLPDQVMTFREIGVRSELIGLAFDERILAHLKDEGLHHDVAFIGSVTPHHVGRAHFLREIACQRPIDFWGEMQWPDGIDPSNLQIRANPSVYGLPMYQIMKGCRITLNYHLDIAKDHAGNLRMFEATGVGSLLMTDHKVNIRNYFEPDVECIAFKDASDCMSRINHLLSHPDEAVSIARAGQSKTLRDHTYHNRVDQLLSLIS